MKIYIPHIHYTVFVKEAKTPPEEISNAKAWVISEDRNSCTLYIEKKPNPCQLAHELVHVLQRICLNRNITFTLEQEHMGYLMDFLMGKILGFEYK